MNHIYVHRVPQEVREAIKYLQTCDPDYTLMESSVAECIYTVNAWLDAIEEEERRGEL